MGYRLSAMAQWSSRLERAKTSDESDVVPPAAAGRCDRVLFARGPGNFRGGAGGGRPQWLLSTRRAVSHSVRSGFLRPRVFGRRAERAGDRSRKALEGPM